MKTIADQLRGEYKVNILEKIGSSLNLTDLLFLMKPVSFSKNGSIFAENLEIKLTCQYHFEFDVEDLNMWFSFFALVALSLNSYALSAADRQQIEDRIRPIGQIHLASQSTLASSGTAQDEAKAKVTETSGQTVYEQYCSTCHRDGVAGAPKFRDSADWQSRLDKKTLDELVASAMKGLNAMPMKGTCMQCNDEEIKNAIQYMLPQS
nr:c-type cytochrome [Legionella maceachernii]